MPAVKKKVRLLVSVPLILFFLPVVTLTQAPWTFGIAKTAVDPGTVIRDCEVHNDSEFILDNRTSFNSFPGLFIDALIPGQTAFEIKPQSSGRVAVFTPVLACNADRTTIPIRGPPSALNL